MDVQGAEAPELAVSTLTVPDALLEWGREPSRAVGWSRDWAREVEAFVEISRRRPLTEQEGEVMLSRLEALVCEAVHANRPDLLVGLDMQTAEWLGLSYSFPFEGQQLTVGRNGLFSWSEVRVLTSAFAAAQRARIEAAQSPDPSALPRVAVRVKNLISSVFPDAEIGSVEAEQDDPPCSSCGEALSSVKITTDYGMVYCSPCWRAKTATATAKAATRPPAPRNRKR